MRKLINPPQPKTCCECGTTFDDHSRGFRKLYCTYKCRERAMNKRFYRRHRSSMIERVLKRRKAHRE